jgi:hypothetical protein
MKVVSHGEPALAPRAVTFITGRRYQLEGR